MRIKFILYLFLLFFLLSCKKEEAIVSPYNGFPAEVGKILVDNCATSGCHTNRSHDLEGRLSLEGWEDMFKGARYGNAVIPFSPDKSFLVNFINRDTSFSHQVTEPTMPFNLEPLPSEDVELIYDWIANGAPDVNGHIKTPGSKKIYIVNQGCDVVAVMDRDTRMVLRYIKVGLSVDGEAPHAIRVSPDGLYWYVIFRAGDNFLEKHRTSDDMLVGTVDLGFGDWNSLAISEDGKWAFCISTGTPKIVTVDLKNMISNSAAPVAPTESTHGVCVDPGSHYIYVTKINVSALYRYDFTDPFNPDNMYEVDLVQGVPGNGVNELWPHEVAFTPDGEKFLVTCQGSKEVRIYDAHTETLLKVITVGDDPSEISFAPQSGLVFITCANDLTTWGGEEGKRGSVAVIDYINETLVKMVYTGYQPHGLAVDEEKGLVYVANSNSFPGGPPPHHVTSCKGANGYMTAIQLSNLELLDGFKYELATDPYAVAIK